ncbi:TAP-like domain-containing protein [Trichoderma evansii]
MLFLRIIQAAFLAVAVAAAATSNSTDPIQEPDWASIVPSRDLEYHDCYNGFKCARLSVPLDWRNASDDRLAHIAMIKLPATVPDDDKTFGGTVFVNPGGPGLSGVSYLVERGANVQKLLVDIPGTRHYEIVSFDPRGIGRTTPTVNCFRSNEIARLAWTLENHANGPLNSKSAISYGLGLRRFHSLRCQEEDRMRGPDEEALMFVNTPSVARDMVEMVDKIDELRKLEAAKGQQKWQNDTRKFEDKNATVPRLQYIGWSYGSILGNNFASMFPGRVGRMVLDGVMDPKDYATGTGWRFNTHDADKLFEEFWKTCYLVGRNRCPFLKLDGDWKATQERFYKWVDHLDNYPMAIKSSSGGLMALRGEDVRHIVANALYSPLQHFRPLAIALYEGMTGNPARLSKWADMEIPKVEDACRSKPNVSTMPEVKEEQGMAVLCSDGQDVSGRNIAWWEENVSEQRKQSKLMGYLWASIRFSCSAWQFRPNWEFRGPFRSPTHSNNLDTDRPAAPLLFLSTLLDPVTPLKGTEKAAKNHAGSVVVTQNSLGHTAWGSAPSKCTWKIVSEYLFQGVMPEKGTVCVEDCGPWDEKCNAFEVTKKFDVDERAWKAMFDAKQPRPRQVPLGLE